MLIFILTVRLKLHAARVFDSRPYIGSNLNRYSLLTRNGHAPDPRAVLLLRVTHALRQLNFLIGTQFHHLGERRTVHEGAYHDGEPF